MQGGKTQQRSRNTQTEGRGLQGEDLHDDNMKRLSRDNLGQGFHNQALRNEEVGCKKGNPRRNPREGGKKNQG